MNIVSAGSFFTQRMGNYTGFWCVAGGWAIDFYLGTQTRTHEDLEVVAFRKDFALLFSQLGLYNPLKIKTGKEVRFIPWKGDKIEDDVIQLRLDAIKHGTDTVDFEVFLTPSNNNKWVCRRNINLQLPLDEVCLTADNGLPILRPEIVLLFKAKYMRSKDKSDYQNAYPHLSAQQRRWFLQNLSVVHPNHSWLK